MKADLKISANKLQMRAEEYRKTDRIAFFDLFYASFQDAAKNVGGSTDFYFQIAGNIVRFQFAGAALVPYLTRALSHLLTEPVTNPDFTFCLWESLSTGRPLPRLLEDFNRHLTHLPWLGVRGARCEVFPYSDERIQTSLHGEKDILTVYDRERKICVYWVEDAATLPFYELGAPLRMPLQWMLSTPASQMIHSGAVGTKELGGVLLSGKGGSGKSTTALNCLNSDLLYLSDDYVLIELEPELAAQSIFQTAKVKTFRDLERFPNLKSWIMNGAGVAEKDEKPMMFIGEHRPEKIIRQLPIKAIVFPRFVAGADTQVEFVPETSAFKSIIASTIEQTPFAGRELFQTVAGLVRRVPSYNLIFGEDQRELPEIITRILTQNQ